MCYSPKDRSCYELHDFSKFYIEEYNMVLENYIVNENQNKFLNPFQFLNGFFSTFYLLKINVWKVI